MSMVEWLAVSDADRASVLQHVDAFYGPDFNARVVAARNLDSLGAVATKAIIGSYVDGAYGPAGDYVCDALGVCLNREGGEVLARAMRTFPGVLPSEVAKELGRVAEPDMIPDLLGYVGAFPADGVISRKRLRFVRTALVIARQAQRHADSPETYETWQAFIDCLGNLRVEGEGDDSIRENYGWPPTTHPDELALDVAEWQFGGRHKNPDFSGSTRDKKTILGVQTERTAVLRNLWTRVKGSVALSSGVVQYGERVMERACDHERLVSPYAVSIGIESEVELESLYLPEGSIMPPDQRLARMKRFATLVRQIEVDGIPAGGDEVWEFAHLPARQYRTLLREVQALLALGALNPSYENPLHITVGGITTKGVPGLHAYLLGYSVMAAGWSTSGSRIRQPYENVGNSWASHASARGEEQDRGGIRERDQQKVMPPSDTAVEFRVHAVSSLYGVVQTLRSMYALGSALRAFQAQERGDVVCEDQQQLAAIWRGFSEAALKVFKTYGIGNPLRAPWRVNGGFAPYLDDNFEDMADLLNEAVGDTSHQSDGYVFREAMQATICSARVEALVVLERTIPASTPR